MKIIIETVPHHKNRNGQVGDYKYLEDGTMHVTVSSLDDKKMELLIAFHELWEWVTSEAKGVTEESITAYDEYYEAKRKMGMVDPESENGFAHDCNYREFHTKATAIEMLLAAELGVDWMEYSKKVNAL